MSFSPSAFADNAAHEIDALHRLLQAWFRAEGPSDPAAILARLDEGFIMMSPAGKFMTYQHFSGGLSGMRGSRPSLIMEIGEVVVRYVSDTAALVTYHERQIQDSGANLRASTALLLNRSDRPTPVWRHLQETWIS
ncbi:MULTISPECIES: DUF4440 domain-containing protein [unclassified Bradyrhizobium]|uniref:DUF4440 domain-containing protein n=1 Tax=unclassified Bradyrhizobium TaxID=2631580 RepID=UPI0024474C31|nr:MULTISPECIES: DUF4440 domain-containing protein [unclassified Bradyrhizobium]MDH2346146.1 DUF4440 domain-containing protein [Bradyrhizobium sp. SSUT77]MDH2350480.1 DUF4440 domain-containing protein [Bradyrhizobium sp. SSUT112]